MRAAEDREVHRLVADVADPPVDRQRLLEPAERAIQTHPREVGVRDLLHGELQQPQVVVPAVDLGEPCGQAFQRLEVAGLQATCFNASIAIASACSSWRASLDRSARSPNASAASKSNRFAWTIERRLSALTSPSASPERRRGLERRLQVRDRHPVVGRPGEHEPEIVVRAHRDVGRHLRLGEHPLQIVPRAPRRRPSSRGSAPRHEPLGDLGVGRRPAELGRELDRRGEVREGLVAGVQAFGPFGGQVVPSTSRLEVAGASVMMREEAEVLVDPPGHRSSIAAAAVACSSRRRRFSSDPYATSWISACENHLVWLTVTFEQAGAHELVRLSLGIRPDQLLEQGECHPMPQHRRGGDHVARARRERVEPRQDHLLDRRRELDVRAVIGGDPVVPSPTRAPDPTSERISSDRKNGLPPAVSTTRSRSSPGIAPPSSSETTSSST